MLVGMAGALTHAFSSPLFSSADELGHFDYAYQLAQGTFPVFEDGPVVDAPFGKSMPVQWTNQHPPLFYVLLAPVVGPLADAGRLFVAGYAARFVNVVLVGALCAAVIRAAREVFPARREIAVIAGLVTASSAWVFGTGGAIYNDILAALLSTVVIGLTVGILREGLTRTSAALLVVTGAACSLTRLHLVVIVIVCVGFLLLHGLTAPSERGHRAKWFGVSALVGLAMAAASGWFYLKNLRLTGSVTGGHPEWSAEHLGRTERPIAELAANLDTWTSLLGVFAFADHDPLISFVVLLLLPALAAAIGWAVHRVSRSPGDWRRIDLGVALLMTVSAVVIAMQLVYSSGGGGFHARYSLPIMLPIAVLISVGLTGHRRLAPALVTAWVFVAWTTFMAWVRALPSDQVSGQALTFPLASTVAATVALGAAFTVNALLAVRPGLGSAGETSHAGRGVDVRSDRIVEADG